MFIYHLDELIKQKEIRDKQKLPDYQIAKDINITRQTFAKLKNNHINPYHTTTEVIENLLKYFSCNSITQLIEYKKDVD